MGISERVSKTISERDMKDAIIFTAGMTAIFLGVILEELHAQTSRLTSDPTRAIHGLPIPGIFVPPSDGIIVEFRTNLIPIVVRQEVTSNVIRRTVWMLNGRLQTNDVLITNTVILITTNTP